MKVVADGDRLPLGSARQWALRALLLVQAGECISVERLIEDGQRLARDDPASAGKLFHSLAGPCVVGGVQNAEPGRRAGSRAT